MTEETGTPIRILLAEDDEGGREVLYEHLTSRGFDVRAFASGESALLAQQTAPADIVITDLVMPGMSGIEVLMRVREVWPATEVIVITGYATVESAVDALRNGAYDFLLKPMRLHQIEAVVQRCAERIRFARENRELRRVLDRMRELNERREKFIALANHELRTPATIVAGLLALACQRAAKDAPEFSGLLDRARESADRICRIVEELGDIAAARSGSISREPVTVGEIVPEIEGMMERYGKLRPLMLAVRSRVDPARILQLDRPRFLRAVEALVQNGVKFTPDGGEVAVWVEERPGYVDFVVCDTGIGVPEEEAERIFEPFYKVGDHREHSSSAHEFRGGGLGVGLSRVRAVAEAHGGEVRYRPDPSRGSCFTLSIPA